MEAIEDVVIIGAGISGLATALGLHRKGIRSVILESSESLRASGFALTIWTNAWKALDALGVVDSLRQNHLCLQRIVVNSADSGAMTAQIPFSAQGKRWPFDLLTGNISKGNVTVVGDALHPMTTDIGQGGCAALKDAIVLARSLGEALLAGKLCEAEEEEYEIIKESLEKYAKERRWRSFDLVATAYLVGYIQQKEGAIMRFLRDKCLSGILTRTLFKKAEFDCGKI